MYNHHANANQLWYQALNDTPGLVGPPIARPPDSIRAYLLDWMKNDGYPFWLFWENVRSWWAIRGLPNLLLLHFDELKADLPTQFRRIAIFLDIAIDESRWPFILDRCSFPYMKANASRSVPLGGAFWDGGAQTFVHKGVNGRWRDTLGDADIRHYEDKARGELGPECAHWLTTGQSRGRLAPAVPARA